MGAEQLEAEAKEEGGVVRAVMVLSVIWGRVSGGGGGRGEGVR